MEALDTFRTPPYMHNCAQAVANRWSHLYSQGQGIVAIYAPLKGGSAPGGMCGALYAATQAMPAMADEIEARFRAMVGATRCRDIKGAGLAPCQACVAAADTILRQIAPQGR